jgi:integrase
VGINNLTDAKCKAAKPREKLYKLSDGHGLHLAVTPAGGKLWRMAYRVDGRSQLASFGPYPLLSLAAARAERDALRLKLLKGEPTKTPKVKSSITFQEASDTYWATRQDLTSDYRANAEAALARHIFPRLGAKPIRTIDRSALLEVLKTMDAAGLTVFVRKTRMWASQVWDWAVEHGHADTNPAALIDPKKAFSRSRVVNMAALELPEVAGFMARLDLEGVIQSAQACRLMALTGLRTQELRGLRFEEWDGDLLRIPDSRMKKDLDLLVPLSSQAKAILENMRARSRGSVYVFPNDRRQDRPMSENAVLYLIGRIGYAGKMTGHGWRSVLSTWANEAGFNPDAIERQLAHVPGDKVRGIYNRAEYLDIRKQMLQAWADWLMPLKAQT